MLAPHVPSRSSAQARAAFVCALVCAIASVVTSIPSAHGQSLGSGFASGEPVAPPAFLEQGLFKVNLTDFVFGKYSMSYERAVGTWASAELTLTGVGMTSTDHTYSVAQPLIDAWNSSYPNLPADMEITMNGWEVRAAARKYAAVDIGLPNAFFYASAFASLGATVLTGDEHIHPLPAGMDTVVWAPGAFLDEVDHTLDVQTFGLGFTLGFQYVTENGLGVDGFLGPMFRGVHQTYLMEGYSPTEARSIVRQRMQQNYWLAPGPAEHYYGNNGPWFSAGLRVTLAI